MDSQSGISVRPMRLKVLYTFDDASKTNCLARWPHLLDIQAAHLDEQTEIGVIELKICIQAIVSASPELVARLGQDYTVYAYDYSEYETPLVGQGMLSWVLASASPTPNAPAHQSKTMVTGRVCKNALGLFSKGAQETLEVKLRLVPVPTVMQSEYIESMQRYRELSSVIPHEFDAQIWTSFLRQNPSLLGPNIYWPEPARTSSPMDNSGIERVRQILSQSSAPRGISAVGQVEADRPASPPRSAVPSRHSTPGLRPSKQLRLRAQRNAAEDATRQRAGASIQEIDFTSSPASLHRRDSIQSGYTSSDEVQSLPPRRRARLFRTQNPEKSDLNIENQPNSLRVVASTAASVRIHRPIPVNPSITADQTSSADPVRPPTPISNPIDARRRSGQPGSALRERSNLSSTEYMSPYPSSDDNHLADHNTRSPEGSHYQGLFEPPFSMPSSPPVLDYGFPGPSSPTLPPMGIDPDSGFMSGGVDDPLEDDACISHSECGRSATDDRVHGRRSVRPSVSANSSVCVHTSGQHRVEEPQARSRPVAQRRSRESAASLHHASGSTAGSRPSSRCSVRLAPKPPALMPVPQSDTMQAMSQADASDATVSKPRQRSQSCTGPMSDLTIMETPKPQRSEDVKPRNGANKRKVKQIQARLDQCIRDGQAPPYCQNCGAIETPTWRRAWSKEIEGSEELANDMANDPTSFYWESVETDSQGRVTKFKIVKKSLLDTDVEFTQVLLCNPCGLWLHKSKTMRPENRWNKTSNLGRKKKAKEKGPTNSVSQATRLRGKTQASRQAESSPAATEASSPAEDGASPRTYSENDNDDSTQEPPFKRCRANSEEPRRLANTAESRWSNLDPMEALWRAIQSSPARNLERRNIITASDNNLTPKPVRRALFPNSYGTPSPLGTASGNSPRRPLRITSRESNKQFQDKENQVGADQGTAFPPENPALCFDLSASQSPRRRNTHVDGAEERLSLHLKQLSGPANQREDSDTTPTKLAPQKSQRILGTATTLRQGKATGQRELCLSSVPPLPTSDTIAGTFEGMDSIIADMFGDDPNPDFLALESAKFSSSSEWVDWLTSDAVSPPDSDDRANGGQNTEDFINAMLFDPTAQKENVQFNPFALDDPTILNARFFDSEPLSEGMMTVEPTEK